MWHASIARLNRTGTTLVSTWGDGTLRDAKRRALALLDGVGRGNPVYATTPKGKALHVRKSLSDEEMEMLTEEWLALPAIDEFGPDGLIEMNL